MEFTPIFLSSIAEGSVLDMAQSYDAGELIHRAIAYAIIGASMLGVAFIFYGGVTFILSGGDDGKIQQAINTIRYAIIGLIITLLSFVIVGFIGRVLGVNIIQYINLNEIFNLVSVLSESGTGLFDTSSSSRLE